MYISSSLPRYLIPIETFIALFPGPVPLSIASIHAQGEPGNKAKISKDVHVYYIVYNYTCTFLFHSLLPLGLGMTEIIGISVGGVVACLLLIIVVLIILICCIKTRNQRMTSIPLGAGSPSTKKKPTTPVHELHSEHRNMYTIEPWATGSPLPYSLQTSTSDMNVQYSEEPRAAGSPSPPPITD